MPCYQVQTCNVELNNADHALLGKALESLGYTVVRDKTGKIVSFSRGRVTGRYDGKTLHWSAPRGVDIKSNEVMKEYSRQVILKQLGAAQKAGWSTAKTGVNTWKIKIPSNSQKVYA